jgi:hypothetical protein
VRRPSNVPCERQPMKRFLIILAAGLAVAGAARADTAPTLGQPLMLRPVPAIASPRPVTLQPRDADLAAAVMPVAVDRQFASKDVTGALGFLCGREPGHNDTGSASAFGSDPHGRFLGAKLSLAF